jgi:hypothetical protein
MPGMHRVVDQALADLRLLRERTGEATQLIQSNESGIEWVTECHCVPTLPQTFFSRSATRNASIKLHGTQLCLDEICPHDKAYLEPDDVCVLWTVA